MNVVLGENLAKYRKKAGYSQEELADKLGVSRQAVSKWERGEASPDTENLIALSRLYGVTLDELVNKEPSESETKTNEKKDDNRNYVHIGLDGIHVKDDEDEFKAKLKEIAHNAVGDACTGSNPNPIDDAKMEELFVCCYYNRPYKF